MPLRFSKSGNPFIEKDLLIGRIDLLKTEDNVARLEAADWDLMVVDEAHRMSASYFGGEVSYTARYRLGELLGKQARHFLLMTATPHRGKAEDFQLFLALMQTPESKALRHAFLGARVGRVSRVAR